MVLTNCNLARYFFPMGTIFFIKLRISTIYYNVKMKKFSVIYIIRASLVVHSALTIECQPAVHRHPWISSIFRTFCNSTRSNDVVGYPKTQGGKTRLYDTHTRARKMVPKPQPDRPVFWLLLYQKPGNQGGNPILLVPEPNKQYPKPTFATRLPTMHH